MRFRLADSLDYLCRQTGDEMGVAGRHIGRALDGIRAHKQDPGVFARYYDAVFAVSDKRFDEAGQLISEIVERAGTEPDFAAVPYRCEELGSDFERFSRLAFAEFSEASPAAPTDDALFRSFSDMVGPALDIIADVDTVIRDMIEELVCRVYVAAEPADGSARRFGGVSSFMIWGGIFVNAERHRELWQVVHFFVHEVTHCWLFGLATDAPLVENPPDEAYGSPLRSDARPMDGIFHATVVCGILVLFSRAWLARKEIDGEIRRDVGPLAEDLVLRFEQGMSVIAKHGRLSLVARDLIDEIGREIAA